MSDDPPLLSRIEAVEDPALERTLGELGLVEDVSVSDGVAAVTLRFDAPYAPDEKAIGDRLREVVRAAGLEPELSAWDGNPDPNNPLESVRNVIPVASGKGGVGKTTVATNLATALAERGATVGLLDADIYGPNVPGMLGVEAEPGLSMSGTLVPPVVDELRVMSMDFLTEGDEDPAMLRGPMVDKLLAELIRDVEWGTLDYLFVDLPPGTGDEQLTLMQHVPVTGAVVVTTPEDIALGDVRKGIRMFLDQGIPVLGLVENMSSFHCPSCGDDHPLYGTGGGEQLATEFDLPLLASIPMDPEIRASGDATTAVTVVEDTPAADQFRQLRDAVTNQVGAVNRAAVADLDPQSSDNPLVEPTQGEKDGREDRTEQHDATS